MVSAPAAIIVHPIASPSSPSVKFTALLLSTISSITKIMNGKNASTPRCGICVRIGIVSRGRKILTNGTISRVE